jgi:hypothetical protein
MTLTFLQRWLWLAGTVFSRRDDMQFETWVYTVHENPYLMNFWSNDSLQIYTIYMQMFISS